MDLAYGKFFSEDVGSFMRSPVREIFKKVDLASIYSFAGGYPDAATFPIDDIRRISAQVLEKYGAKTLQYGATQGVTELREVISQRYGVPVENIQITTSSQQGIDVCSRVFIDPGDVVLTTAPTYLGALQSFKSYRAEIQTLEEYGYSVRQGTAPAGTCRPRLGRGGTTIVVGSEEIGDFCDPAKMSDSCDSPRGSSSGRKVRTTAR